MTTGLKARSRHGHTNVGNLVGGHPPNCLTSPTILTHHKQTIPAEAKRRAGTSVDLRTVVPDRLAPSGMTCFWRHSSRLRNNLIATAPLGHIKRFIGAFEEGFVVEFVGFRDRDPNRAGYFQRVASAAEEEGSFFDGRA